MEVLERRRRKLLELEETRLEQPEAEAGEVSGLDSEESEVEDSES